MTAAQALQSHAQSTKRYQFCSPKQLAAMQQWQVDESDSEYFFVTTEDNWQLGVTHYPAQADSPTRNFPLLLCHGLGSNHFAYDPGRDRSISRYFAKQGFDVFAVDLRGHGISEKPGGSSDKTYGWGIYEYRHLDLPVLIDAVLARTGAKQLQFIGHSMGGILLYHFAASADQRIRAGITLGSSMNYYDTGSFFRFIEPLSPITHLMKSTPLDIFMKASGKGSRYSKKAIDRVLVNPDNISQTEFERFTSLGTHPISSQVLRDLALAINNKGMQDNGIDINKQLRQGYPFPILAVSGSVDKQCPPKAANRFGTHHRVFGSPSNNKAEYGHHDLVIGTQAAEEVWPVLLDWLIEHDDPS